MMTSRGEFDCRIALDKEGPIHDFEWSPSSREFIVIYGYMPAKAVLFSYKVTVIAELGTLPRNFIAFNPQGRLFAIAGFGNLSGVVDIWDREQLAKGKLFSMDASNASVCQWSPDGHFLLTAILSPRLRVDNGVRIWHCTGQLVHIDMISELYQAFWRPALNTDQTPFPFPAQIPPAPAPSPAAAAHLAAQAAKATRPAGAYRPPGARGTAIPDAFKRLDIEGGSGSSSPTGGSLSRQGSSNGAGAGGSYVPPGAGNRGRRAVPGAAAVPGAPPTKPGAAPGGGKKNKKENGNGNGSAAAPVAAAAAPAMSGAAEVSGSLNNPLEKKTRNLQKKLKAIQELKDKQAKGEKLEQTQLQKIAAEAEIKAELAAL